MINRTQDEIIQNWKGYDVSIPLVSVRCITYNHEKYIAQALDSFLMQKTTFPFEIVVHDDASTDKTADIIREYAEKFPKIIKPIYETENQYSKHDGTIARIMNAAMKGKYIAYCEGDDYWIDENKLQLQFEALENNPDCSICVCKVQGVRNSKREILIPYAISLQNENIVTLKEYCVNEYEKGIYTFQTSSYFIRDSIYREYMETKPPVFSLFPFGDMPLLLYCLTRGNGYYIDKTMSTYRLFSGGFMSTMKSSPEKRIVVDNKIIKALTEFDIYTEKKYHEEISGRIVRAKLNIAKNTSDKKLYREVKKEKAYGKLSLKNKVFYMLQLEFPFIYTLYEIIRRK